jgi:hypothetical protein
MGDPNVEANWVRIGMFGGGKAQNGGYAPGPNIWLRARTCGLKGHGGVERPGEDHGGVRARGGGTRKLRLPRRRPPT